MPVMSEPFVTKLNSGDLGWVWGVLMLQGPRKPAAITHVRVNWGGTGHLSLFHVLIERPLPMAPGMVSEFAEAEKPPAPVVLAGISLTKSNLKSESWRRAILAIS